MYKLKYVGSLMVNQATGKGHTLKNLQNNKEYINEDTGMTKEVNIFFHICFELNSSALAWQLVLFHAV